MTPLYRCRQISWPLELLLGMFLIMLLIVSAFTTTPPIKTLVPVILLAIAMGAVWGLNITVTASELQICWGWCFGRENIPLREICSLSDARIPSLRRVGVTMDWNKEDFDGQGGGRIYYGAIPGPALEIRTRNGFRMVIGTPDPSALRQALEEGIQRCGGSLGPSSPEHRT